MQNQIHNNWQTEKLEEEILDLSQRIKIAKLILDGKTYAEIAEKVKTSTSTVSKIGQIIKYGKGSLQKVLENKIFIPLTETIFCFLNPATF